MVLLQNFAASVPAEVCGEVPLGAHEVLLRSSLTRSSSPWERKDFLADQQARRDLTTDTRMDLFGVACVPTLADYTGPHTRVRMLPHWVDSHHGFVAELGHACTQTVGMRRAVVRHGGRMGSRHATPRCWTTRQTARVSNQRVGDGCDGWSGVGARSDVVVAAPPPLSVLADERSAVG